MVIILARCVIKGESIASRIIFVTTNGVENTKRTDTEFSNQAYVNSHQDHSVSPLVHYEFPCVTGFVLDYMHVICLGVVRKVLKFWRGGPDCCRVSQAHLNQISERLVSFRDSIPSEFVRKPRPLSEMDRWKATECRQFLLYTGPIALKGIVKESLYHFLACSIAMTVFLTDDREQRESLLEYAEQLMECFVSKAPYLYGERFCVYNVHAMLHLGEDVRNFQCSLNFLSAFPFENFLYGLKRLVRNGPNPLVQAVKHYEEMKQLGQKQQIKTEIKITSVSDSIKDSCIMLTDRNFAVVKSIFSTSLECDVYPSKKGRPIFTKPCSSKLISVMQFKQNDALIGKIIPKSDILCKAICLPSNDGNVMMPLRHSNEI